MAGNPPPLNFLAALKTAGRGVTDFGNQKEHFQATVAAMRRGDEIIYQGYPGTR